MALNRNVLRARRRETAGSKKSAELVADRVDARIARHIVPDPALHEIVRLRSKSRLCEAIAADAFHGSTQNDSSRTYWRRGWLRDVPPRTCHSTTLFLAVAAVALG